MRWRKRRLGLLLITLVSLLGLGGIITFFPPGSQTLVGFILLIFLASSSLACFVFANTRSGILVGIFIGSFFALRSLQLDSPGYLIVLFVALLLFELSFRRQTA